MIKQIVVTGSGGMLGSEILRQGSTDNSIEIYALSSQSKRLKYEFASKENIFIFDSIASLPSITNFVVLNCAFPRTSDGEALATAINTTVNTLYALADKGAATFVNISSQSVYTQHKVFIPDESFGIAPDSMYALAKYSTERLLFCEKDKLGIVGINIRLASLISPDFDQRMINRFFDRLLKNQDIYIQEGNTKISFMEKSDAARALLQMAKKIDESNYDLYNLGNNDWLSLSEIAYECVAYYKKRAKTESNLFIENTGTIYNNVIDSSRFNNTFSYRTAKSMVDIISLIGKAKMRSES